MSTLRTFVLFLFGVALCVSIGCGEDESDSWKDRFPLQSVTRTGVAIYSDINEYETCVVDSIEIGITQLKSQFSMFNSEASIRQAGVFFIRSYDQRIPTVDGANTWSELEDFHANGSYNILCGAMWYSGDVIFISTINYCSYIIIYDYAHERNHRLFPGLDHGDMFESYTSTIMSQAESVGYDCASLYIPYEIQPYE